MSPSAGPRPIRSVLHTFALAVYLPVFLYVTNSDLVEGSAMLRAVGVMSGAALVLIVALRPVIKNLDVRGIVVSVLFLSVVLKNFLGAVLHVPYLAALVCTRLNLLVDLTGLGVGLWAATALKGRGIPEARSVLNVVAGVLLAFNVGFGVLDWWTPRSEPWRVAATPGADAAPAMTVTDPRDIYYIVVDSYARADTMADLYGVTDDPLIRFLETKGFHVAGQARSNYPWTLLSVASSLNLNYLPALDDSPDDDDHSQRALVHFIQNNAVMRSVKTLGYEVVLIASDYSPTADSPLADRVLCNRYRLTEFENHLIGLTPVNPLAYAAHRAQVRCQLTALEALAAEPDAGRPRLVFAHLMVPHPPFVFDDTGCGVRPPAPFRFADGVCSADRYVEDYRRQAAFVGRRLEEVLGGILERSPRTPVVILQADHGPGSQLDFVDPDLTNINERFGILSAYLLPESSNGWARERMSPVNNFRIVFNEYFGAGHPILDDRSYYAPRDRLYEFVEVSGRITPNRLTPSPGRSTRR